LKRRERLAQLAQLHDEWVDDNLESAGADFDSSGRVADSDYNQHHVDVDASGEAQDDFHQQAAQIFEMS